MSAKALAQDMYIEELERNLSDAAKMMLDDGYHGAQSQQLTAWLNATAARSSYSRIHRTHIQVFHFFTFPSSQVKSSSLLMQYDIRTLLQ